LDDDLEHPPYKQSDAEMVPTAFSPQENLNVAHREGARLGALGVGEKVYASGSPSAAALLETILSIL
jgi:hypothetical protein